MTDYQMSRPPADDRVTNLLRDVAFNRHSMNDGHHVSPYDNGKIQVGTDGIVVKLTQGLNEDAFKRTLSQATRATIGVDLNVPQAGDWEPCEDRANSQTPKRSRDDGSGWEAKNANGYWQPLTWDCNHAGHRTASTHLPYTWEGQVPYGADWEEMLKGGLQTALESQVVVFQVQGVSRTCTHQIVRTRNAAYHQQSQRASYYGAQPEARMPESVFLNERARNAWIMAKKWSDRAYRIACEEDISYQDARFALLEATDNYIMCEYSLREFINVYAYRGCSMFSWEIVYVMREMRRLLIEAHPWLEPYIKISCEKTKRTCLTCIGKGWVSADNAVGSIPCPECKGTGESKSCTFQGWEEVEGQCDFPWAKEGNRTFVSTAHGIKQRPGITPVLSDKVQAGWNREHGLQSFPLPPQLVETPGMTEATPITEPCPNPDVHDLHEFISPKTGLRRRCLGIQPASGAQLPRRVPLGERLVKTSIGDIPASEFTGTLAERLVATAKGDGVVEFSVWEDDGGANDSEDEGK